MHLHYGQIVPNRPVFNVGHGIGVAYWGIAEKNLNEIEISYDKRLFIVKINDYDTSGCSCRCRCACVLSSL